MTAVNQVPVAQYSAVSGADDYFQTVVINSLLVILKDQSLSSHHHIVIEAVMSIFKTQGLKCVTFLPQVRYMMVLFKRSDLYMPLDYPSIYYRHSHFGCEAAGIPPSTTRNSSGHYQATRPQLYARYL